MPTLTNISQAREHKPFKKREYRPWDAEGTSSKSTSDQPTNELNMSLDSNITQAVLEIDPKEIKNWDFNDRPESELGDIELLANDFTTIGQQQPCIVRPFHTPNVTHYKYELIVGERRWRAAQLAKVNLKVIIKDLSDPDAALVQATENLNRKGLSDYARGMSYARLIQNKVITINELTEKLGISKPQMYRLLSFSKIPATIIESIGNFSKISARTAEQIKHLSDKGEDYVSAIILYANELRNGKIGHTKLTVLIENFVNSTLSSHDKPTEVYTQTGKHLFTWKNYSIHFSKEITVLLEGKKISIDQITLTLKEALEDMLRSPP